jgi:hypothetical protein
MHAQPSVRRVPMARAVCLLVTAGLRAQAPAPPPPPSVKVGQAAPDLTASDLTAPDANGRRQRQQVKLSDFSGKVILPPAFEGQGDWVHASGATHSRGIGE